MCNPDVTAMPVCNRYAAFNVIACSLLFTFGMLRSLFTANYQSHKESQRSQIGIAVTSWLHFSASSHTPCSVVPFMIAIPFVASMMNRRVPLDNRCRVIYSHIYV